LIKSYLDHNFIEELENARDSIKNSHSI